MDEEKEQNESLRTEYTSIASKLAVASTRNWQAAAFLVGGSFAAAGLMASRIGVGQDHIFISFIMTVILGIAIYITLWFFLRWQVRRDNWRTQILYEREREIEKELKLYTNHYIYWLDEIYRLDKKNDERHWPDDIPSEKRQILKYLKDEYKYTYPGVTGNRFIVKMTRLAIAIWPLLAFVQYLLWICEETSISLCQLTKHPLELGASSALLVTLICIIWLCRIDDPKEGLPKQHHKP